MYSLCIGNVGIAVHWYYVKKTMKYIAAVTQGKSHSDSPAISISLRMLSPLVILWLIVYHDLQFTGANSEGTGETVRMHKLA